MQNVNSEENTNATNICKNNCTSNLLRSQSLYRKYGPNLPTSLTLLYSIDQSNERRGPAAVMSTAELEIRLSLGFSRANRYAPDTVKERRALPAI